jgi:hypothetical protein
MSIKMGKVEDGDSRDKKDLRRKEKKRLKEK